MPGVYGRPLLRGCWIERAGDRGKIQWTGQDKVAESFGNEPAGLRDKGIEEAGEACCVWLQQIPLNMPPPLGTNIFAPQSRAKWGAPTRQLNCRAADAFQLAANVELEHLL